MSRYTPSEVDLTVMDAIDDLVLLLDIDDSSHNEDSYECRCKICTLVDSILEAIGKAKGDL